MQTLDENGSESVALPESGVPSLWVRVEGQHRVPQYCMPCISGAKGGKPYISVPGTCRPCVACCCIMQSSTWTVQRLRVEPQVSRSALSEAHTYGCQMLQLHSVPSNWCCNSCNQHYQPYEDVNGLGTISRYSYDDISCEAGLLA